METMETIETMNVQTMTNALFVQFMADVDNQIRRVTPEALKIRKSYAPFTEACADMDRVFLTQQKDNETVGSDAKDLLRDEIYRSLSGHVSADLLSFDPLVRPKAQVIRNRIDAYGYLPGMGNTAESAQMSDLGKELMASPLKELVEDLGLAETVKAMVKVNDEFIALSRGRVEAKKIVTLTMKEARGRVATAYRNMILAVNSQVAINNLMDRDEPDRPSELSLLTDAPADPLTDVTRSLNALIKSYRTSIAQSGSRKKKDPERPGEL